MARSFERSELTARIVRFLAACDKGDRITYPELSKAVNALIESGNHNLNYARFILIRDYNAVWGCIRPKIGIFRLNDQEIAKRQGSWFLNGARNKLRRGETEAEVVEIEALNLDEQSEFAVASITRHIAQEALSKATQQRVDKVARGNSNDLPSFNAVEWMIYLSPKKRK